ncbi:hypothetical protein MKX01_035588 [Papaver californicum]|nr:hypothetical protein MKX01_035588 [Papaver californicum]
MGHSEKKKKKNERKYSMISSIFMHADDVDILLMIFGFIGSVGDGFGTPLLLLVTSKFMNNLDVCSSADPHLFLHNINKVPNFLMNCTMFVGSYVTAFLLMWRLALVGFPFVVFLIIPGLIYGRILMSLSRKMREEYNKAGSIVEQAISSIRSVYSFVGEEKTINEFSEALNESVKLGLKQGLAKGLALGSNSVTFAIWSFLSWYGSRLVMYHGAQGGTVFAVGAALCSGGLSLGAGLSNLKYFSEACAAGERIMEVITRIPKIDSDSIKGKILPSISDTIAAVQNGHVMETGSHHELLKLENGLYSSLVRIQEMTDKRSTMHKEILNGNSLPCICGSMSQSNSQISSVTRVLDECNNPGKDFRIPPFWRLLALYQPEWKQTLLGCISSMIFGAVQPFYCLVMAHMIFVYFLNDHNQIKVKTMTYSCIFAGLAIFSFIVNLCQHYNFAVTGEYLTKRIRERMLSKILTFEVGWFDQDENSSGAICSRLAKDANMVRSLVGDRMSLIIQTFSSVIIACTMGLIIAWRLAVLIIAVQPLIIVCFYARRVLIKSMYNKSTKAQNQSSKLAAEAVSHLRTITSFSSQSRILNMFRETQLGSERESTRLPWIAGLGLGFSQSIITFSWALNFWYGGKLVSQGGITTKSFLEVFMILISTGRVIAEAGSTTSDLAKDVGKDTQECATQLVGLATCLPYAGGTAKAPTPDCCTGLKQVLTTSRKCLCVLVKDRNDPSLGLKINSTLALGLPSVCKAKANISECLTLLHLSPSSPEAKVFEDFNSMSNGTTTTAAPASTETPKSGNSTAGSSPQVKNEGGMRMDRWLGLKMVGGFLLWYLTSYY